LKPVHNHAGLRKREGHKSADGIERDKPVGDPAEKDENAAAEDRQDDDAIGVDQPPPAVSKGMREVVILCDGAAEAREIGEGGIGRQRENDKNGADSQIIKKAFAKHRSAEHGENALVAGLARIGGSDSVNLYEIRNSRQQHREKKNNHGESALGVLDRGLPERLHAVADRVDARQG